VKFDHRRQVKVIQRNQNGLMLRAVGEQNSCRQSCSSRGLCGGSAGAPTTISMPYQSSNQLNPAIGAELDVQVSSTLLLVSSSLVYLVPVVLMLLFSVISGVLYPRSEALVVMSAGLGFGVGLLLIHAIGSDKRRAGLAYKRFAEKHLAVEQGAKVHR